MATGAYLRTDFWAKITTGGSYGHTCYVARELARTTERFVCFLPVHYSLLSDLGIKQVAMDSPGPSNDEAALVRANEHYHRWLTRELAETKPAFIYERLCLGNFVGARLSQELRIPYFVEYNGSEISMRKSFGNGAYQHEDIFLAAEEAAFRQATLISVVSEAVRDDVVRRGIDSQKVLVNPNGVDLEAYRQPEPAKRAMLRRELGFSDADRVVGFIGTFGGWHGVDVLAAALPTLCKRLPAAKFLLIGDGDNRGLIDSATDAHQLKQRVVCTGRVAHHEGARLLGVCDIYVSPHSSHMVDSRFFGSPTKLFEYMGLGGGIVASDLEQIGQVLSPAFHADALPDQRALVSDERAVLCKPGDVTQFVDAVAFLVERPEICKALGRNARLAAEQEFSWERHIERLWNFAVERMPTSQGRQP
ncbi:MAG: glycosyltransferase [Burkholderiales bacterium]